MQAFATESSLHPGFAQAWCEALSNKAPISLYRTIAGARRYTCFITQPKETNNINVSRSVYWPECGNNYLPGFGPNISPDPSNTVDLLLEDDFTKQDGINNIPNG